MRAAFSWTSAVFLMFFELCTVYAVESARFREWDKDDSKSLDLVPLGQFAVCSQQFAALLAAGRQLQVLSFAGWFR